MCAYICPIRCVQRLRKQIASRSEPLTRGERVIGRVPSFYTTRSIINLSGLSVADPSPYEFKDTLATQGQGQPSVLTSSRLNRLNPINSNNTSANQTASNYPVSYNNNNNMPLTTKYMSLSRPIPEESEGQGSPRTASPRTSSPWDGGGGGGGDTSNTSSLRRQLDSVEPTLGHRRGLRRPSEILIGDLSDLKLDPEGNTSLGRLSHHPSSSSLSHDDCIAADTNPSTPIETPKYTKTRPDPLRIASSTDRDDRAYTEEEDESPLYASVPAPDMHLTDSPRSVLQSSRFNGQGTPRFVSLHSSTIINISSYLHCMSTTGLCSVPAASHLQPSRPPYRTTLK